MKKYTSIQCMRCDGFRQPLQCLGMTNLFRRIIQFIVDAAGVPMYNHPIVKRKIVLFLLYIGKEFAPHRRKMYDTYH